MLFNTQLLHQFFPEFVKLQGIEAIGKHEHKDNFYHTIEVQILSVNFQAICG